MKPLCLTIIFLSVACLLNPIGSPLWWKITSRVLLLAWALWLQTDEEKDYDYD